jgi:EEF1A lysine methyltransferase 4
MRGWLGHIDDEQTFDKKV